jgi:glutamine synthetase
MQKVKLEYKVYGLHNEERLTGEHETSGIHEFSYGYSTRDTSIRIPAQSIVEEKDILKIEDQHQIVILT